MRLIIAFLLLFFSVNIQLNAQYIYPKRELRGAWIATIANIDWPSSNHETSGQQIKELKLLFDKLKAAGINTVFFQVRTECDALYDSPYEPWSYWLTGVQGKAPYPFYDPLQVAVQEAHSRGMEIQAWLNPLRVEKKDDNFVIARNNVQNIHPDWILKFRDYKMINPGIPDVRHYVAKIVGDIVRRYDVDGIHFDDYFYPYSPKIKNEDRRTFIKYNEGIKDINDWRRNNINKLIEEVHDTIEAEAPKVKFGISPFGIVENKFTGSKGFEAYKILYCDPLTWIKKKTIDYIVPQLYWEIGNASADYKNLLLWWASVTDGVQLYIGTYATKMALPGYKGEPDELEKQIRINRQIIRVGGTVFYSAKAIAKNYSGFADSLKMYFKHPSLVPAMTLKDSVPPLSPSNLTVTDIDNKLLIKWDKPSAAADGDTPFIFVVYRFTSLESIDRDDASHIIDAVPGSTFSYIDNPGNNSQYVYLVSAVDKFGNESRPVIYKYLKK